MPAKLSNDAIEIGIVIRDSEKSLAFYRDVLGLEYLGDLEFPGNHMWRFQAGGSSFTLTPGQLDKGGAVVRFAMRGEGQYGDYALEAGATLRKSWTAYYARAAARFVF